AAAGRARHRPIVRRRWLAGAAAGLLGGAALAGFVALNAGARRPAAEDRRATDEGGTVTPTARLAVLPFGSAGGPENARVADDVRHDLQARLARLARLQVVPEASAGSYARADVALEEIARELDVD